MAPLGALSQARVTAEASLLLGWRISGLLRRERALRLLPSVGDEALPDWCALAEDEAHVLYDGWGGSALPGAEQPRHQVRQAARISKRLITASLDDDAGRAPWQRYYLFPPDGERLASRSFL
jgi:hypothetical protein